MGQTAAELQREVAEQRQRIETKLQSLRERLRTDAMDAREAVAQDTSDVTAEAKERLKLEERIQQHPLVSLAAAFGAGIALGLTSEAAPSAVQSAAQSGPVRSSSSFVSELFGAAAGSVGSSFKDDVLEMVRNAARETKESMTSERPIERD